MGNKSSSWPGFGDCPLALSSPFFRKPAAKLVSDLVCVAFLWCQRPRKLRETAAVAKGRFRGNGFSLRFRAIKMIKSTNDMMGDLGSGEADAGIDPCCIFPTNAVMCSTTVARSQSDGRRRWSTSLAILDTKSASSYRRPLTGWGCAGGR